VTKPNCQTTSVSHDQRGRLVLMFGAALIVFLAAAVTVAGNLV